jgi:hypothetical protein
MVDAVVHLPFGATPWGVPGYYGGARQLSAEYFAAMRGEETFNRFLSQWIDGTPDHQAFLSRFDERFGAGALDGLRANRTWQPERPITYGWRSP